jgi:PAS domain S-box-containing protein
MFHLKADGTFLNYKAARQEMLLVSPKEFLGKRVQEVLPPSLAQLTMEHIANVLNTDKVDIYEYQLEMRDGELRDFECRMVSCREDEIVTIVRDITERKRMEEALRNSKRLLERAFYNLRDAVLLCNTELTAIIDCNPAASKVFGHPRKILLTQEPVSLFANQESFNKFKEQLSRAHENKGVMTSVDCDMKRSDGTVFPAKHDTVLLEDERGTQMGWVSIINDLASF